MDQDLLRRFCTPPALPLTDQDARLLSAATAMTLSFEGGSLPGYTWGKGKTVLLVHGWGSRASHLALMGRYLARSGYRAVAYDCPAHTSRPTHVPRSMSNMFEHCRTLSAVAAQVGPLHAVVGHSFGALCAVFTAAGHAAFAQHRIEAQKLVLISTPPTLMRILESFCRHDPIGPSGIVELRQTLEEGFHFSIDTYALKGALDRIQASVCFVHDTADEVFPLAEIRSLQEAVAGAKLLVTQGLGHEKILVSRTMMAGLRTFLDGSPP